MFSLGFWLICLWTSAIAGNSSSALNATSSNASAISTSQLPFGINMSDLPKSMRNISNHTIQTILASHPKMRIPNVGAKHSKTVIAANATDVSKTGSDVTLPTTLRNLTQHIKNGGHRSSSSQLLDRLASKVSLVSLTSSKVSDVSNKTSPLRNERASINATLIELKNATDRINNKTIEKRSADNTSMTDRASSFFQTLPAMLANTTSNVTSWARRLFGVDSESSRNAVTKKVTRDTPAAELVKALVNTSALNSTSTEKLRSAVAAKEDNSSLLNLPATIIERAVANLTADIPAVKESNSSVVNSTKSGIKRSESQVMEVLLKRQNDSTVEGDDKVAKLTGEIPEKTANSSLIAKSSASPNNRTRRHSNGGKRGFNVIPSRPSTGQVPVYGRPPANACQTYGMVPPAAYGMTPAAPATTTPAFPVYVYNTPAPYAPPAASAPAYGIAPDAPTYTTPATSAPVYGMAPVAPIYATPAPVAAPAYEQNTESYYTAPVPMFTTNVPSNLQPTPSPYGALPLPIYPAQPYGSMPSPPSPTASPWY